MEVLSAPARIGPPLTFWRVWAQRFSSELWHFAFFKPGFLFWLAQLTSQTPEMWACGRASGGDTKDPQLRQGRCFDERASPSHHDPSAPCPPTQRLHLSSPSAPAQGPAMELHDVCPDSAKAGWPSGLKEGQAWGGGSGGRSCALCPGPVPEGLRSVLKYSLSTSCWGTTSRLPSLRP